MNSLQTSMRGALVWIAPFAVLALLLLWQTDWGRAFGRTPPAETAIAPQPLSLSLLPEYQPSAPPDSTRDAVERTLFNPTRRPAPTAVADAAKPKLQRGQFTLSGTLVVDGKATAFLREVSGGKSRRVAQGETVNGMVISEIRPDRVRLTVGDESEDLILKVATGPKTTIQPVAPGPITASAAPAGAPPPTPAVAQARDVSAILAERRRVARAQELAAQGLPPGSPLPQVQPSAPVTGSVPPPPTVDPNSGDPGWQAVYQRMQQPRGR
ncbi:MAG TPA: hypothetical protein VMN56_21440 [Casimicrobiaceae bacterium]|nr:hypothetical protein [Casimicrobiaceae bacterium]